MAANHHELAQDKMVQEKPIGDVFAVHVCLLVLSGVSLDILFTFVLLGKISKAKMFIWLLPAFHFYDFLLIFIIHTW